MNLTNEFQPIREWASQRGIYEKGDPKTQLLKLGEEFGELCQGVLKQDRGLTEDAIGDMVVVLTNLANLCAMDIEVCINSAYEQIKNRKGTMSNGTFVKET